MVMFEFWFLELLGVVSCLILLSYIVNGAGVTSRRPLDTKLGRATRIKKCMVAVCNRVGKSKDNNMFNLVYGVCQIITRVTFKTLKKYELPICLS